ncbi:efflux RND transporter periplasmic adaptor subunit [Dyella caseinilytica]|uniref:Efflux RND transporter periplasmic adaptor subunit n=1 Tax=Dyella caseinilytica TaxID=1849581 RepID=A0ABX7GTJ4_9GAMM|nr:efflux RND transporter periplasmic adaptor subunit [Dyella caseinilytica]QRN53199.1 efflux RND transporter periplasmic adaptor subunit [Dyella caseinilytica]GGA12201.1 RND transporter MFP subunit [Dyella caseinilytica]
MSHNPAPVQVAARPPRLKKLSIFGAIAAVLIVGGGLAIRYHDHHELVQWTDAQLIPTVRLAPPSDPDKTHVITLPGHLEAWYSSPIHARVSGYLKNWYKDIGDKVKAGEVLATVDTPELDQQLEQAKAVLVKAQADANLANITSRRWQHLLTSDSVSKQEVDEKIGEAQAAQATVLAAKADVDRLDALETFKKIVAPFNGLVTARHTDVGDLITANNDSSNQELFTVSDTSHMRLYVPIPEVDAGGIKPGMKVNLSVPEHPGRTFEATLLGNSGAINQTSGSMLAQFEADNTDGALKPGDYADVKLALETNPNLISVPASALIFRAHGAQVAVFGPDSRAHLRDVHIGMDLGQTLLIDQGLTQSDRVIENPPDSLMNGDRVQLDTSDNGAAVEAATEKGHETAR